MSISVVMTTFNRAPQLALTLRSIREQHVDDLEIIVVDDGVDDHITPWVAQSYDATYVRLERPKKLSYRNQARPLNVGLRRATGDIVILQNAECLHVTSDAIRRLTSKVTTTNAVFAHVVAIDRDDQPIQEYCGPANQRPYFFCGAIMREWFTKLRGFDEDFIGYGYEDDDMADRLHREGVSFVFTSDVLVHHQWHEPAGEIDMTTNEAMFRQKLSEPVTRNLAREWGAL